MFNSLFIDLSSLDNTVLLAGSGRSGTTWVSDIINYKNNFRLMFEPFHSFKVKEVEKWHYRQYIKEISSQDKYIKPAEKILKGNIRYKWVDQFTGRGIYKKRLIKDIRINLFLKWISLRFPMIPLILLLRHPCAVAASKIKLDWDTHLDVYLKQEDLVEDFLQPFRSEIGSADDLFEKHIFMWCIDNFVPLSQFKKGELHLVFYENLCVDYRNEVEKIFDFLGYKTEPSILKIAKKASALSREDSPVRLGRDLIGEWKNTISIEQTKKALRILSLFGLDRIYNEGLLPRISPDECLNG